MAQYPLHGNDRVDQLDRDRVTSMWRAAYAPIKHLDPILVGTAFLLTVIGLVAIYSARLQSLEAQGLSSMLYVSRQLMALAVGLVAMGISAAVDYRHLRTYAVVLYLGAMALLAAVLSPLGAEMGNAQRWIIIGGFQLQPSEFAKIAVLIALAAILHEAKGAPGLAHLAGCLAVTLVPAGLVFLQPDLGTAIVIAALCAVLLLIGGLALPWLIGLVVAAIAGIVTALRTGLIADYQLERLTAFANQGDSVAAQDAWFQTEQSVIAIGSGQFAGKGIFQGTQTGLSYVPENHTDFIFTVIGEETGFLGAMVVLALFGVLLWRALRIAVLSKDTFGRLLAVGVAAMLALQVFVNVGMNVGIMPVTGIPLPFVSYGGTSLIVWFAIIGLLLNLHMRRF